MDVKIVKQKMIDKNAKMCGIYFGLVTQVGKNRGLKIERTALGGLRGSGDLRRTLRTLVCLGLVSGLTTLTTGPAVAQSREPPPFLTPPPPAAPVPLASPRLPVNQSVARFVDYASASGIGERETVRKQIWAARDNAAVAQALCREVEVSQGVDHSRALIALSILGELRNPVGEKCLIGLLHQPLPEKGTVVAGEILEQTALGTLQGKAADGLAYAGNPLGDRETLWAAGRHPSRVVRAEAINAYMWNHQDSPAARETLMKVVRPGEQDFIDRPRHEPGMTGKAFNARLEAYAAKHPAPKPEVYARHKPPAEAGVGDGPPPRRSQPSTTVPSQGKE